MGMNIIEREGISFSHPARFILVGTMNPEEGDLRPQLLDRFALSVEIYGIRDARERVMIMERNLAFEANPEKFRQEFLEQEQELSRRIDQARKLIDSVEYTAVIAVHCPIDSFAACRWPPLRLVILKAAAPSRLRWTAGDYGRDMPGSRTGAAAPHPPRPFQQEEITWRSCRTASRTAGAASTTAAQRRKKPTSRMRKPAKKKA